MSVTFASVRGMVTCRVRLSYSQLSNARLVKQEIARAGILPIPWLWAKTTRLETPGPALLLHFVFQAIFIIATPLSSANGTLVFTCLLNYARTTIGSESSHFLASIQC